LIMDFESGEIVDVNPYLAELLDIPEKEFVGKHFWEIGALKNIVASKNDLDKLLSSGALRSFEPTLTTKHGKKIKAEFVSNEYLVNYRKFVQCNIRDMNERWLALEGIKVANDCFVNFGTDPANNLKLIMNAMGEILNATCAIYNRKEGGLLVTMEGWDVPPGGPQPDNGEGYLCFDVLGEGGDAPVVVSDLQKSEKFKRDPNIKKHSLQTYVGFPVKLEGKPIASLCAVFKNKIEIEPYKLALIEMLGRAAAVEEERLRADGELKKKVNELEVFYKAAMGREDKILELKQEVKELREQLPEK
jgi:PAS domain S-box-containing protein